MIKAKVSEVVSAFQAFSRIFEETKLDSKATWRVSRLLGKLKQVCSDHERSVKKLYRDAGATISGTGAVMMDGVRQQQPDEKPEEYEKRRNENRDKINNLSDEVDKLGDNVVDIDYDPISITLLPTERKNDKGEKIPVEYRATDFANCGPFIVEKEKE